MTEARPGDRHNLRIGKSAPFSREVATVFAMTVTVSGLLCGAFYAGSSSPISQEERYDNLFQSREIDTPQDHHRWFTSSSNDDDDASHAYRAHKHKHGVIPGDGGGVVPEYAKEEVFLQEGSTDISDQLADIEMREAGRQHSLNAAAETHQANVILNIAKKGVRRPREPSLPRGRSDDRGCCST